MYLTSRREVLKTLAIFGAGLGLGKALAKDQSVLDYESDVFLKLAQKGDAENPLIAVKDNIHMDYCFVSWRDVEVGQVVAFALEGDSDPEPLSVSSGQDGSGFVFDLQDHSLYHVETRPYLHRNERGEEVLAIQVEPVELNYLEVKE